jgi:cytoskeletal protein RodZ
MATDTQKYATESEREARHSALAEFSRDERRPAVLLLSALVIAVLFFAIGLLVGRWTAEPDSRSSAASSGPATQSSTSSAASTPSQQPTATTSTNTAAATSPDAAHRFALLVATYDAPEKSQPVIKTLQEAGYTDIRTTTPRPGQSRPAYSVLVGHFTQDEARAAAQRMRSANNPLLKNAKVVEASGN